MDMWCEFKEFLWVEPKIRWFIKSSKVLCIVKTTLKNVLTEENKFTYIHTNKHIFICLSNYILNKYFLI